MKNILLIDIDSTIPNIALMKLSSYYKDKGYSIELLRLFIPYYPNRKKKVAFIDTSLYYKVFASSIFKDSYKYVKGNNIIFGGTGYDPLVKLDKIIENYKCDYTLYNEIKRSYNFITRGCIRNCYFCLVRQKEGFLHKVNSIEDIIKEAIELDHKELIFMDNNILAYKEHNSIFKILAKTKFKIDFNQGLDFRLLNEENQLLLSKLKYQSEYIFAFDDWSYKNLIDQKKYLFDRFGKWKIKLYLYVNPEMELSNIINRIIYCKHNNYLPYVMRDIRCWDSINNEFYIDIAAYCNQPNLFKKISFKEFLSIRHKNKFRINKSNKIWEESK